MYELVLLDADDTIFDYNKAEEYALENTLHDFKIICNIEEVKNLYRVINRTLWRMLELNEITKLALRTERFRLLFEKLNYEVNESAFSEQYLFYLAKGAFLIEGAEHLCYKLSKKYKLAILTNGIKEVQLSRLENSLIKGYIHDIIVSEEAGANKPDASIFLYAFNKLKHIRKETSIIIGDSLTSDIMGGINFGIDTCWYNPNKRTNNTKIIPKFEIHSLHEIMDIL